MDTNTKGPWQFDEETWTIRAKAWGESDQMADYRGVIVADFSEAHGNRKHAFPECRANANLIAAAPEMLGEIDRTINAIETVLRLHTLVPAGAGLLQDRLLRLRFTRDAARGKS